MAVARLNRNQFRYKKPAGVLEPDYSNQFTGGEIIAFTSNGLPYLLHNNKEPAVYGSATYSGDGAELGVDSAFNFVDVALSLNGTTKHTWAWVGTIHSFDNWGGLITRTRSGTSNSNFSLQEWYGAGDIVTFVNGGSGVIFSGVTAASLADGIEHKHVLARDGSSVKWYIDGKLEGTATITGAAIADVDTNRTTFGAERVGTTANAQSDWVIFNQVKNVAWGASEAAEWSKDPYQIIKSRKAYFIFPESGVAPTTTWANDEYYKTLLSGNTL